MGHGGMRRRLLHKSLVLAILVAAAGLPPAIAQQAEASYSLDIPAQDLGDALHQLALSSQYKLLYKTELVAGKRSPGIAGEYTTGQALAVLLQGAGLRYRITGENTILIEDAAAEGAGASRTRQKSGPQSSTMPPPSSGPVEEGLAVRADAPVAREQTATDLQKVLVTGSNIRTMTAAEEGPAPLTVITREELQLLGYSDISDILRVDVSMSGWSSTEGQYSTRSTLNMRGLGEQYTLVLLNGRRFSAEQAADISLIPIGAVERVEILKDGASALYGSDAVGGVVNIITRNRFDGIELELYHGNTTDTDVSNNQVRLVFGGGDEKLRFLGALAYTKRNSLLSEDREITRSQDMRPWGGYDARSSATNPPAFFVPGRGMLRLDVSRFGVGSYSNDPDDYVPYDPESDKWSRPRRSLFMPLERTNFFGSVESNPFDSEVTLFGELLYSDAKSSMQYGTSVLGFADPSIGPIPATNPYNPFGVDISQMNYRTYAPLLGRVAGLNTYDTQAVRLAGGLRGWWGSWSYEGAVSYFKEESVSVKQSGWSKRGLREALYRTGPDAFNPFCYGCNDAAQLAGVLIAPSYGNEYVSRTADFRTSGPLFENWAGTVSAAAGVEYREESYRFTPDPVFSSGDVADEAIYAAEGGVRDVKAVFAEATVPLIGPSQDSRGVPVLEFNAAVRAEEYSDFGSTTNPKASLRWQVPVSIPVMFRVSYGTSFKAPQLSQLLESGIQVGETVVTDPVLGEMEGVVVSGTNPDLQPEDASYSNIGFVVSPIDSDRDRLTFAVDYFRIRQRDVIIQPTAQDVYSGIAPGSVDTTPGMAQQLFGVDGDLIVYARMVNGGDRNTDGLDFTASWERKTEHMGDWMLSLSSSRLLKRDEDIDNGQGFVDFAGYTPYPEWRGNLTLDWKQGAWRAGWVSRYTGGFNGVPPTWGEYHPVGSYALTSVSLAYDTALSGNAWLQGSAWTRDTVLKIGVNNLFDRDPAFILYMNGYFESHSDILGRSVYVSLKRRL